LAQQYFSTLSHKRHEFRKKKFRLNSIFPRYLTKDTNFGRKNFGSTVFFHSISQKARISGGKSAQQYFSTLSHKRRDFRGKSRLSSTFPRYLTKGTNFGRKNFGSTVFFHVISQKARISEEKISTQQFFSTLSHKRHEFRGKNRLNSIFPHYLTKGVIFGEKNRLNSIFPHYLTKGTNFGGGGKSAQQYFSTLSHKTHEFRGKNRLNSIFPHYLTKDTNFGEKSAQQYFSTLSHKRHYFRKKKIVEHKMCFGFLYKFRLKYFSLCVEFSEILSQM